MDSDIVEVSAHQTSGEQGLKHAPMQAAIVKFANDKIGKVSACVEQWMPYQFNVDLLGTDGGLRDNRFFSRKLPGATDWATFPTITPNSGLVSHHPFDGEIGHFLDCIRDGKESHASIRDAVNTHHAVFAIDESAAAGGTPVAVQ
jgi:predicted dehydrogenase